MKKIVIFVFLMILVINALAQSFYLKYEKYDDNYENKITHRFVKF